MADISMCMDKKCPSRVHCYRYRARANEYRQAYMGFDREGKEKCEAYTTTSGWDDRSLTPMKELENGWTPGNSETVGEATQDPPNS